MPETIQIVSMGFFLKENFLPFSEQRIDFFLIFAALKFN